MISCGVVIMSTSCDLQPRILSLPDTVGDFISARYPALLADPDTQPEIYNSAASDYGVYASPELYGSMKSDDYVLYASADDYVLGPQDVANQNAASAVASDVETGDVTPAPTTDGDGVYGAPTDTAPTSDDNTPSVNDYLYIPMYGGGASGDTVTVARGDTLYALARRHNMTVDELARLNNLTPPYALQPGQKLRLASRAPAPASPAPQTSSAPTPVTTTVVELQEITVAPGDTLYSLSRKYATPVNDLAVMNKLSAPFALSVGQKLRVPKLDGVPVRAVVTPATPSASASVGATSNTAPRAATTGKTSSSSARPATPSASSVPKPAVKPSAPSSTKPAAQASKPATQASKPKEKISSDPAKKLPAIAARSSSKFSWPVRGTILSHFGAKSGGLFNDGINIGAARGTTVKAAENGVVAYAGNEVKGMGNLVIVQHSGGWMTVYAHMDSLAVRRGVRVTVGQKIGTVGATGKVTKPQLHFEIRKGTKAYNPSSYLKS